METHAMKGSMFGIKYCLAAAIAALGFSGAALAQYAPTPLAPPSQSAPSQYSPPPQYYAPPPQYVPAQSPPPQYAPPQYVPAQSPPPQYAPPQYAPPQAVQATEQQNLVDRAHIAVDDLRRDREFGNAAQLLRGAKGVLIVPSLVKLGFFFGGEGGEGVLLTRNPLNQWSDPAFYSLASASFGLQIGIEESELILMVMTDRAMADFMADEFKIGAQAGLAVITLGSEAEASVTSNFKPDIIVWSSASGAYAGLTLNGTLIKPRDSWNQAYYGQPQSALNIVSNRAVQNPGDLQLRQDLSTISQ